MREYRGAPREVPVARFRCGWRKKGVLRNEAENWRFVSAYSMGVERATGR